MVTPDRRLAGRLAARARFVAAAGARRKRKTPTRIAPPVHLADAYDAALGKLLEPLDDLIRSIVLPAIPELVTVAPLPRADARYDATPDEIIRRVLHDVEVGIARRIPPREVEALAQEFGIQVSSENRLAVNRQFRQVLGIDLPSSDPFLAAQLDLFRSANVTLITRLVVDEQRRRVEDVLRNATRTGTRVEQLREQVQATLGVSRSRASLIARDQVLKLNGELTQLRHREAGVEEYEWSSSNDSRVRGNPGGLWPKGTHWDLDSRRSNRTYRWDDPPVVDPRTGRRAHPGEDFQCRCVAVPVIDLDKIGAPRGAESVVRGRQFAPVPTERLTTSSEPDTLPDVQPRRRRTPPDRSLEPTPEDLPIQFGENVQPAGSAVTGEGPRGPVPQGTAPQQARRGRAIPAPIPSDAPVQVGRNVQPRGSAVRAPVAPAGPISFASNSWAGSSESGYTMAVEGGTATLRRVAGPRGGRGTWQLTYDGRTVDLGGRGSFGAAESELARMIQARRDRLRR